MAVLLLDRPQQTPRLVEIGVVRPAVERREALQAEPGAAPAVGDPVGAGGVPGHPDHETAVMAEIRRPPVLRLGHELAQVLFEGGVVEAPERLRIVEVGPHRVGGRGELVQDLQIDLVRPPVAVGLALPGGVPERTELLG